MVTKMKRRTFLKWLGGMVIALPFVGWLSIKAEGKSVVGIEGLNSSDVYFNGTPHNPADALMYIFKGTTVPPILDDKIDLDTIDKWRKYCDKESLVFNKAYKLYSTTAYAVMYDVGKAGKADIVCVEGKWSVNYDYSNKPVIQVFTPYDSQIVWIHHPTPHTWRDVDIVVPEKYTLLIVCRIGDKVCVVDSNDDVYEGKVSSIEPISNLDVKIKIINPEKVI